MTILVTGSSGQVGSHLVDALRATGHETYGIDRVISPQTDLVQDVRAASLSRRFTALVHCAAHISVPASITDPRHDAAENIDGTIAALELARRCDAARFVFFSSAAVYGRPVHLPIKEDFPVSPESPYGLSKYVGEQYANLYRRLYGLETVVVRPFNIFSARQPASDSYSGVITTFLRRAKAGEPLTIHGSGAQTRDFVHVHDVVQATMLLLRSSARGTFNVGTGKETSVVALANAVNEATGSRAPLVYAAARDGDIERSVADIGALRSLGFQPKTNLTADLQTLVNIVA